MTLTILGIRHHGPGSARSVRQALSTLQPDVILVEGPPEAADLLPLLNHPDMQPPVAWLIYVPDEPKRAVYYPFAIFSPEWQAIHYGLSHNIPIRLIDLPQTHQMALPDSPLLTGQDPAEAPPASPPESAMRQDPLRWVAEAAGYSDSERWWEHLVEQRRDSTDLFQAILELMTNLRAEISRSFPDSTDLKETLREATMRQAIRTAQAAGFERIVVVCGAWHAPVLVDLPPARKDAELLKGLPKVNVKATWIPWTYGRLTYRSGYGAGIESPGYYHHLWSVPDNVTTQWLTRVAHLLREQDLSASTASVIEAVRLAEALAAIRDRPLPGLPELNEATRAIFCFGDDAPLQLIEEKLIVGEKLGQVPAETPLLPLAQDLQRQQKRLRLPPEAAQRTLELDLRQPTDLERSHLLHRLQLLGIQWGKTERATGKGTFREIWRLQWQPELAIAVIEANIWGNTILDAATFYSCETANRTENLAELTGLVEQSLLADLPAAISQVMLRLQNVAALTSDIPHLMDALPPLANVLRYGNVRQTDTDMVSHVVTGLVTRICIGLPAACTALNDAAAQQMFTRLMQMHQVLVMLQNESYLSEWQAVLQHLADQQTLHGLLAGRCCRLLFDQAIWPKAEVARRMHLALSLANEAAQAAAWLEGFLHGSGQILLHQPALWQILDAWVTALNSDTFMQLLPLLRRTFATFTSPERRQLGQQVQQGESEQPLRDDKLTAEAAFDPSRAALVLPLAARLLGLTWEDAQ